MTSRREYIARVMQQTGLHSLARRIQPWRGLIVLNYHRLGDQTSTRLDHGVFSGSAESFARQIDLIRDYADLIGPCDIATVLNPAAPPGRHVLITFDDGYRDNYELAFPVLEAKRAQALFFVISGFLDQPRLPWNDEISWILRSSTWPKIPSNCWLPKSYGLSSGEIDASIARIFQLYVALHGDPDSTAAFLDDLGEATGSGRAPTDVSNDLWMTWDMVREMRTAGMEFGGHTINHPALADLPAEAQAAEIGGVRDRLTAELGQPPVTFSYPYGGKHQFTDITRSLVADHGYRHAFSFYGGINTPSHTDPFNIQRLYVAHDTTDTAIEGLLTIPQIYGLVPPRLPWRK